MSRLIDAAALEALADASERYLGNGDDVDFRILEGAISNARALLASAKEDEAGLREALQRIYDEGTRIQADPPDSDRDTVAIFHMTNMAEVALAGLRPAALDVDPTAEELAQMTETTLHGPIPGLGEPTFDGLSRTSPAQQPEAGAEPRPYNDKEKALCQFISDTPPLLSLLYDTGLLPEQTHGKRDFGRTMMIAAYWRKQFPPAPGAPAAQKR